MMDARVQRRVQRYGWDLAATRYEALWVSQLAPAHEAVLQHAQLRIGEAVLDVACGSGLIAFAAASQVGAPDAVVGVDLSGEMVVEAPAQALCEMAQVLKPDNAEQACEAALVGAPAAPGA